MCMKNNTWYNLPKDIKKEVILPLKNIISADAYKVVDKPSKWYNLPKNLTTAFKTLVEEYNRLNITDYSINSKEFVWYNLPKQISYLCRLSTAITELYQNEPILKHIVGVNEGDIVCIENTVTMTLKGENLTDVTSIKVNNLDVATFNIIDDNTIEFNPIILAEYPQTNFVCNLIATNSIGDSNTLTFVVKNDFEVSPIVVATNEVTELEVCVGDSFTPTCNTALGSFRASNPEILEVNFPNVNVLKEGESYLYYDITEAPECGRNWVKVIANPAIKLNEDSTQKRATILEGEDAVFTFNIENASSFQWQVSDDNGATWSNISNGALYSGVTTSNLTIINTPSSVDGNYYKCLVEGISPCDITEVSISPIFVNAEAGETLYNESKIVNAVDGQFVALTAGIQGDIQSVEWVYFDGIDTDIPITDGGIYSGSTTQELFINPVDISMNGYTYSIKVTTTNTEFTSAVAFLQF